MSQPIIAVEQLGKCYRIRHQQARQPSDGESLISDETAQNVAYSQRISANLPETPWCGFCPFRR
jgi:hypothetical protein